MSEAFRMFFATLVSLFRAADNAAQALESITEVAKETSHQYRDDARARRQANAIANKKELAAIKAA